MSPTIPRKLAICPMACVKFISCCTTVRMRTFAFSMRGRSDAAHLGEFTPAGSFTNVSYSARLPKPSSCVSLSQVSAMKTRGPMALVMPGSPGTLVSAPAISKCA